MEPAQSCSPRTTTSLSENCNCGIYLPLHQDRDFDGLVDELQLLNLRALSGPSAPIVAERLVCPKSQPCSRVVPVESPQCSAWFCWETGMSHHSVGALMLGLNLEQLNGSRFDLGFHDSPVTWSRLLNLLASLLPRASKMRLSTSRSPSAVRNLTLFSTLRIAHLRPHLRSLAPRARSLSRFVLAERNDFA